MCVCVFLNSWEDFPHFLELNWPVTLGKVDTGLNTSASVPRSGEHASAGRCDPGWSVDTTSKALGWTVLQRRRWTGEWGGRWHDFIKIQPLQSAVRKSVRQNPSHQETQRLSAELRAQLSLLPPGGREGCKAACGNSRALSSASESSPSPQSEGSAHEHRGRFPVTVKTRRPGPSGARTSGLYGSFVLPRTLTPISAGSPRALSVNAFNPHSLLPSHFLDCIASFSPFGPLDVLGLA